MEDGSSTSTRIKLIKAKDFPTELLDQAAIAKKRFYTQSMFVEPGKFSKVLLKIFIKLLANGIDCRLNVDYFGILFDEGKIRYLNFHNKKNRRIQSEKKLFYQLITEAGVKVAFLNQPNLIQKIFPYSGRNHSKFIISDNTSYIGGMNFSDRDIENEDFMIKIESKELADALAKIFLEFQIGVSNDQQIKIGKEFDLLIDSGKIGKSIILNHALSLVKTAKKNIVYISQFPPNGPLIKEFNLSVKNGVKIFVITQLKNDFNYLFSLIHSFNKHLNSFSNFNIYYLPKKLHSKALIIDDKYVLFGSHNLVREGVIIGTGELSLLSSNRYLLIEIRKFYEDLRREAIKA